MWQWWGMCSLRNDKYLVSIVPTEINIVAVQKYKLCFIKGKRRLFCDFWNCLCQHSNFHGWSLAFLSRYVWEVSSRVDCHPARPISFHYLELLGVEVKSVPPLVLSFAATLVLCFDFEDGVPLMHHHCHYCYCYYLFAPKASVVVGFLLSLELYLAAEFLDWMKVVWWGWQTGGKEPGEVWCRECVTK